MALVVGLAFLSFAAWSVAAIFTYQEYDSPTYDEGFLDPILYDLLPWYFAAVALTGVTLSVGIAVIAHHVWRLFPR
jgi:hypothetical protein